MSADTLYTLTGIVSSVVIGLLLTGLCIMCGLFGGGVYTWTPSELRRQQAAEREEMEELHWGMEPGGMAEELAAATAAERRRSRLALPVLGRLGADGVRYLDLRQGGAREA